MLIYDFLVRFIAFNIPSDKTHIVADICYASIIHVQMISDVDNFLCHFIILITICIGLFIYLFFSVDILFHSQSH